MKQKTLKRFKTSVQNIGIYAVIFLLAAASMPFQLLAAPKASSSVSMNGFVLSGSYSVVANQPTGTGQFANGNVGAYYEGSCIPTLIEVTNTDSKTGDIDFTVDYDYYRKIGQDSYLGIIDIENLTTALNDPNTANNLNQFTFTGTSLSNQSFLTSTGGQVSAVVDGPYAGKNGMQPISAIDDQRHVNLTLQNVPAGETVHVLVCSRLGIDASQIPGASLSASASGSGGGGGGNMPIDTTSLLQLPSLTITKTVDNTGGGAATPDQWNFNVSPAINGISTITIAGGQNSTVIDNVNLDGTYTVTENNGGPQNYTLTSITGTNCTAGAATLAAGKTGSATTPLVNATCIFTNTYVAPPPPSTLVVTKVVVNDDGGTAIVSDFPLFVNAAPVVSGATSTLSAGTYVVTETSNPTYAATFSGDCDATGNIILAAGENKTCTITNDDVAVLPVTTTGTIMVIKTVINDNGGTAVSSDFTMNVTATNPSLASFPGDSSGTAVTVDLGAYVVAETAVAGYASTLSADCSGTMGAGEIKNCTITNDDIAPPPPPPVETATTGTLIVINTVVNDNGGTAIPNDFTVNVSGTNPSLTSFFGSAAGTFITLDEGAYAVTQTPISGYTVSLSSDCTGAMTTGTTMTCTITNDDIAPPPPPPPPPPTPVTTSTLIVRVIVVNDNGGGRSAADFPISASGTNISLTSFEGNTSGTVLTLDPGAYIVSEVDPANYSKNLSAECTGTISAGQTIICTITNDDQVRTGGAGTTVGGGGGGGGSTVSPAVTTPPAGIVLGVEDVAPEVAPISTETPVTAPEPRVLGVATELPRTGLPINLWLTLTIPFGLLVSRRRQ